MQHLLQVSRRVDYGLRAMIYLAALPDGVREPLQEVAQKNGIPKDFLAKILKDLADAGLVSTVRGPHGGVSIGRPPTEISFLDVIEAVEGPVQLNLCLDDSSDSRGCTHAPTCTMQSVWRAGQERMLDVYRATSIASLVPKASAPSAPVPLNLGSRRNVDGDALR